MLTVAIILMLLPVVINIISIQVAARVNNVAVFTEIIGTVVFGVLLFILWGVHAKPHSAGILFNTTPFHNPTWYAFALAGLLGAFTLVGFELAADMSEDAVNPVRSVPRGVLWAVGGSVVLGMIALIGFTVAIPDLKTVGGPAAAARHRGYWLPSWLVKVFVAFVVFSMFAILVVGSGAQARLVYSMSRDNMLPFSAPCGRSTRAARPRSWPCWFGVILGGDLRVPQRVRHPGPRPVVIFLITLITQTWASSWPAAGDCPRPSWTWPFVLPGLALAALWYSASAWPEAPWLPRSRAGRWTSRPGR